MEVKFEGKLEFEGSESEFKAVMAGLKRLSARGVKIGTWPTPDHPAGSLMVGTVPLPEQPTSGIVAMPEYLDRDLLNRLIVGMPRFKLIDDICGGLRTPHLHLHDEVILLDQARFKEAVVKVVTDLTEKLAETAEYPEVVGAIGHLAPGGR